MKYSLLDRAIKNYENGNYTKSIQQFEKILKLNPSSQDAIINKAACLAELGKYEEAVSRQHPCRG